MTQRESAPHTDPVRHQEAISAAQLQELRDQVAELRRSSQRRWHYILVGATLVLGTGALTATAQVVTDSLKSFTAGNPAVATDVNFNFALLKTWVERKVGAVSNPDNVVVKAGLSAATVSATSLAISSGATLSGALSVGGTANIANALTVQNKVLSDHIRDYVRNNCSVSFGWKDSCTQPASCSPSKSGEMYGNGSCTGSLPGGDATCGDNWFKMNLDGDVNDDDSLFIRFNCK